MHTTALRRVNGTGDPLDARVELDGAPQGRAHDDELVAGESRNGVGSARRRLQALGDRHNSRFVAPAAVDELEAVDVAEHDVAAGAGPPPVGIT
ncbi:MAG TPA: hypothetical protein VGO80_01635 [Solirubrobacteraceae bacterium]|nr:hypothetical protein [Solirubrobacteraceae bacterium]